MPGLIPRYRDNLLFVEVEKMFTMQELAALRVALKRNSKEHLEEWISKYKTNNANKLLEQFDAGISKEIQIQIYYHENDDYNELWKVVGTPKGTSGAYYVRATECGGFWYTVGDPLGYCERDCSVKNDVLFIICNSEGEPVGASSNINPTFPTLKQAAGKEWDKVKDGVNHVEEDTTKNFYSMCWDGSSTLNINQWLESFMDPDLYPEEIADMYGYPENWVMKCKEIGKEAISTFDYLGVGYAIYKVKFRHEICGVEYYEFYCGRYPFMGKYESYVAFYASCFDSQNIGTMYPRKIAFQKLREQLKDIYNGPVCEYQERYGEKFVYPLLMDEVSQRLINGDFHRVNVDAIADKEKQNPTFELITPALFDKYGSDLEIVSRSLGCTVSLRFDESGKLKSYI